ncbi:extradiol dioxygenase [Alkalihalophilus pseudofirmus]|nr:extradiol dioxygenase [Alkalihalophilus pseudofirmus]
MDKNFKPSGYNSLSPYFVVNGAQKMVDLLTKLFNGKELRRYDMPDGSITHVEIQIDDSVVMIGDASEQFPPNTHLIHIYVPDVDAVFEKAMTLGCFCMELPNVRKGDPDRRGTFKDFAGNIWSVATQL